MIVRGVELDALLNLLRDRRFQQNVITGAIALAAVVSMAREGWTRNLVRVVAWDKRGDLRQKPAAAARRRRRP